MVQFDHFVYFIGDFPSSRRVCHDQNRWPVWWKYFRGLKMKLFKIILKLIFHRRGIFVVTLFTCCHWAPLLHFYLCRKYGSTFVNVSRALVHLTLSKEELPILTMLTRKTFAKVETFSSFCMISKLFQSHQWQIHPLNNQINVPLLTHLTVSNTFINGS